MLGHFEKASAGLLRELLHDLFAVGVTEAAAASAASATSSGIAASASTARVSSTWVASARITATRITPATRVASARIASTRVASAMPPRITARHVVIRVRIGEENCVHERVGALGRLDGTAQANLAALVHAVRQNNECLAALLLAGDFVRGQEDRVVQLGAAAS